MITHQWQRLFLHIYIAGLLILFLSQVDQYLIRTGQLSVPGITIFLILVSPLTATILMVDLFSKPIRFSKIMALYYRNGVVLLPFLGLLFFSLLFALDATVDRIAKPVQIFLQTRSFLVFLLVMLLPLFKVVRGGFRGYVLLALSLFLGTVAIDVVAPATFSNLTTRAAGLAGNPNASAFIIVMMIAVILRYDRVYPFDLLILALGGVGIFATLSRSGIILFVLQLLSYLYFVVNSPRIKLKNLVGIILSVTAMVGIIFLSILYLVRETELFSGALAQQRRLALLTGGQGFLTSNAAPGEADIRIRLLEEALELVNEAPLTGHGTDYTSVLDKEPHNIYLSQWIDNGLPGLLSYVGLIFAGGWLFYRRQFPAGLSFIAIVAVNGVFNHNILDDRTFLILFGMLCTLSLTVENDTVKSVS